MSLFSQLPDSVLQCSAIFLSIIIEALPFVLIGSLLSGAIEIFINPNKITTLLPKNKILRVFFGTFIGFIFPSCECGIIPIFNRILDKNVPSYTAIPFLVTAPIINPIVLFATYSAFGNSMRFVLLRFLGAIVISLIIGIFLAFLGDENILKTKCNTHQHYHYENETYLKKLFLTLSHAIDEFFDTGRYLIFGSLVASIMQIYVPTRLLTSIGHNPVMAVLIMMLLAFILSLCSEADAFIGASLLSTFGIAPVLAFLLVGPMVDIKNLLMMLNAFKSRFILQFVGITLLMTLVYCLIIGGLV